MAHSVTTGKIPLKPWRFSRRHSAAPFRSPAALPAAHGPFSPKRDANGSELPALRRQVKIERAITITGKTVSSQAAVAMGRLGPRCHHAADSESESRRILRLTNRNTRACRTVLANQPDRCSHALEPQSPNGLSSTLAIHAVTDLLGLSSQLYALQRPFAHQSRVLQVAGIPPHRNKP